MLAPSNPAPHLPSKFILHEQGEATYKGVICHVDPDQKAGKIASGIGTIQVYEDAIVGGSGCESGRLVVGRKAVFRLRFNAKLIPKAHAVHLGLPVCAEIQLLWRQHARAVDLRVQDREASTEFRRLVADHLKHVCDKKESHLYGEIKAAIGRG